MHLDAFQQAVFFSDQENHGIHFFKDDVNEKTRKNAKNTKITKKHCTNEVFFTKSQKDRKRKYLHFVS